MTTTDDDDEVRGGRSGKGGALAFSVLGPLLFASPLPLMSSMVCGRRAC